jgi:hypothetical protein
MEDPTPRVGFFAVQSGDRVLATAHAAMVAGTLVTTG